MNDKSLESRFQEGEQPDQQTLDDVRSQMIKFARTQISDPHAAEDAVQEALLGALKNAKSFQGKAAFKTWVFAILKNKIIDIHRKRNRTVELSSIGGDEASDDETLDMLFNDSGHWHGTQKPKSWGDPEGAFKDKQFWSVLEICLENLPEKQAKIFMMREYLGLASDEICENEELSQSNLHVILYRARLRLQKCLEARWFEGASHA